MNYDVVIVGGGLSGASLAIALQNSGLSILVLEANASEDLQKGSFDARSLALSDASKTILETLGVWQALASVATSIETIHVSKQSQFGRTLLKAVEHEKPAFGYVLEMAHLNQAFQPMVQEQANVTYWQNARLQQLSHGDEVVNLSIDTAEGNKQIAAALVVAADGTFSSVRSMLKLDVKTEHYNSAAIVANIGLRRAHKNIAYERFTQNGLIALLPMRKQRASLVWALDEAECERVFALDDASFLQALQATFGYRLGRFTQVGRRAKFPLNLSYMPKRTANRVVFVGNAAQTLHPVAGQGFNLGLRDVAVLAEVLNQSNSFDDISRTLQRYEALRQGDRDSLIQYTDSLVRFFGLNNMLCRKAQSIGLTGIDNLTIIKQALVSQAMGYNRYNSKLACRIPL